MRSWPMWALPLGLVLQVTAWVFAIPPYSTYDELEHVYRASSAWHGQFTAVAHPPPGVPGAVIADRDLVEDGYAECMRLPYTTDSRCRGVPGGSPDTVLVTSGAALYNPLYYVLVSPATALGKGTSTVMWVRLWSGLVTFSVVGLAVLLTASWPDPGRAVRGIVMAAPPMLTISMAVVAPNGLEMAAGLLWWVSLVTVTRPADSTHRQGTRWWTWCAMGLAGCLLALLRSLGPIFLVASLAVILVWRGPAARQLWRTRRAQVLCTSFAIAGSLLLSLLWILTQHIEAVEQPPALPEMGLLEGIWTSATYLPGMITLFVGAIPARNLQPPQVAVIAWLVPFTLLLLSVRWRRDRATAAFVLLMSTVLVFPVLFQGVLFGRLGFVWQSRYILPLAVGVPLLAALLARTNPIVNRINGSVTSIGVLIAHTSILQFGLLWYSQHSPLVRDGRYPLIPGWMIVGSTALGAVVLGASVLATSRGGHRSQGSMPSAPDAPSRHEGHAPLTPPA